MFPLCPQSGIGFEWSPKLVSRQRLLGFSEALICLSYSGNEFAAPERETQIWAKRVAYERDMTQ